MRTISIAILAALAGVTAFDTAAADLAPGALVCDIDDDLYRNCDVVVAQVVVGPGCVGVALGERPECEPLPVDA